MSAPAADGQVRAYVCAYCASVGVSMRFCSACRSTMYCSVQCQKKDWKRHQLTCGQPDDGQSGDGASKAVTNTDGKTGDAANTAAAADTTVTVANADGADAVQQLTHKETLENNDNQTTGGLLSTTNIIIAGALSLSVVVAGWFAYSYFGNDHQQRRPQQQKGRKPPQRK